MNIALGIRSCVSALLLLGFSACSERPSHDENRSRLGFHIENSMRQGLDFSDSTGKTFDYRNIWATITNDTTIPITLDIELTGVYHYPVPLEDRTYRLFHLPDQVKDHPDYHDRKMNPPLEQFLLSDPGRPSSFSLVIQPRAECALKFGVLTERELIDPGELALLSMEHGHTFQLHDSLIAGSLSRVEPMTLWIGLDFFRWFEADPRECFALIPCGHITYAN